MENIDIYKYFAYAEVYYMQNLATAKDIVSTFTNYMEKTHFEDLSYSNQIDKIVVGLKNWMRINGYDKQKASLTIRFYTAALIKTMNLPPMKAEEIFTDIFKKCFND